MIYRLDSHSFELCFRVCILLVYDVTQAFSHMLLDYDETQSVVTYAYMYYDDELIAFGNLLLIWQLVTMFKDSCLVWDKQGQP